jgi:hypothetical protein
MAENVAASKRIIATIITVIIGPFRLFTDPFFKATSGMDTSTMVAKRFGFEIKKCRHCNLYFSSISGSCRKSPNGRHRE